MGQIPSILSHITQQTLILICQWYLSDSRNLHFTNSQQWCIQCVTCIKGTKTCINPLFCLWWAGLVWMRLLLSGSVHTHSPHAPQRKCLCVFYLYALSQSDSISTFVNKDLRLPQSTNVTETQRLTLHFDMFCSPDESDCFSVTAIWTST